MRIGLPKEIKNHEHRVAMTPDGVATLVSDGHELLVQAGAGEESGFPDSAYLDAGAHIVSAAAGWAADLVVKVKEPLASEYAYFRPNLTLFTFLHLAAVPQLAEALMKQKVCALGYETVQTDDGNLPVLAQMSCVAGRVAMQLAFRFLQKENGTLFPGKGRLAGGIDGVPAAHVLILGAGHVGLNAAESAAGQGARVTLLDANAYRVDSLKARLGSGMSIETFSLPLFRELLHDCDILIGAALVPGKHAPELIKRSDLQRMQQGGVFVDVSIDQGGISETSRATTYDEPVYEEEGVIHCCLPNLPGAVPLTSTMALTSATLPYIRLLANHGMDSAIRQDKALMHGVNVRDGAVVHPAVAESLGYK